MPQLVKDSSKTASTKNLYPFNKNINISVVQTDVCPHVIEVCTLKNVVKLNCIQNNSVNGVLYCN